MTVEGESIVVVTVNLCCGLSNSLRPVRERAVEICRRLEQSDADVVHFQEVWTPGLRRLLRKHLPSYPYAASVRGAAGQPAGGMLSASSTPIQAVRYSSWRGIRPQTGNRLFRRTLSWTGALQGMLTFEVPAARAVLANVHLTANRDGDWSPGNRHEDLQAAQIDRVHEVLSKVRSPRTELMVVAGDFNLPSSSPLYPRLTRGTWRDPFAAADVPTFHAQVLPPGASAHRVDYLLIHADPVRYPVTSTELMFTEEVPIPGGGSGLLSDHMAQRARIQLPARFSPPPHFTPDAHAQGQGPQDDDEEKQHDDGQRESES